MANYKGFLNQKHEEDAWIMPSQKRVYSERFRVIPIER